MSLFCSGQGNNIKLRASLICSNNSSLQCPSTRVNHTAMQTTAHACGALRYSQRHGQDEEGGSPSPTLKSSATLGDLGERAP